MAPILTTPAFFLVRVPLTHLVKSHRPLLHLAVEETTTGAKGVVRQVIHDDETGDLDPHKLLIDNEDAPFNSEAVAISVLSTLRPALLVDDVLTMLRALYYEENTVIDDKIKRLIGILESATPGQ